jgi:cytochrome c2
MPLLRVNVLSLILLLATAEDVLSTGVLGIGDHSGHFADTKTARSLLASSVGDEDVEQIFQKAKCVQCHKIPGIRQAHGRVGPSLVMGTTAPKRLRDPRYSGSAKTTREYILESILNHNQFIVKGYRSTPMPIDYNKQVSGGALDKMITYLSNLKEGKLPPTPTEYCRPNNSNATKQPLVQTQRQKTSC